MSELTKSQLAKKSKGLCVNKRCMNKRGRHRNMCTTCSKQQWRKNNPIKYAYQTLKQNSKRRKKEFTLTFDQFKEFCVATDILVGRGRTKGSFHVDRIDESKGYTADNIQPLECSENVKKYIEYRYWSGEATTHTIKPQEIDEDLPF